MFWPYDPPTVAGRIRNVRRIPAWILVAMVEKSLVAPPSLSAQLDLGCYHVSTAQTIPSWVFGGSAGRGLAKALKAIREEKEHAEFHA